MPNLTTDLAERVRFHSADLPEVEHLDEQDRDLILSHTVRYWATVPPRPQIGDHVYLSPNETRAQQVAYLWADGTFQTGDGRFHLRPARLEFTGRAQLPKRSRHLVLEPTTLNTLVWVFHHGQPGDSRAVHALIPRRVWQYIDPRQHRTP